MLSVVFLIPKLVTRLVRALRASLQLCRMVAKPGLTIRESHQTKYRTAQRVFKRYWVKMLSYNIVGCFAHVNLYSSKPYQALLGLAKITAHVLFIFVMMYPFIHY